jgi:acyl carrier protein
VTTEETTEELEPPMSHPVDDPVWTPILQGLHATAMDCLQTSFALLADSAHGRGSHLALGAAWYFRARPDGSAEAGPDERAEQARALLGLRTDGRWMRLTGPQVRRLAGGYLYVTADAYDLPWCPYAGHEHMRHSFLAHTDGGADADVLVVDGYHNDTAWGPARPGVWRLDVAEFDAAMANGAHALAVEAGPLPVLDVGAVLAGNAARRRDQHAAVSAYVDGIRAALGTPEGMHRFVLDVWLLGRERQLHEDWLAAVRPDARVDAQGEAWRQLAARSYLARRRADAGRPVDGTTLDTLAGELRALLLADGDPVDAASDVEAAVFAALRDTLHVDDERLRAAPTLRDLPGFNSFRLVDVIDRVEHDLGVTVPGDALNAGNLRSVGSLCAMFDHAGRTSG